MDLALGAKKLIVMMQHFDKSGEEKLRHECSLPLTARACVSLVVTDLGLFSINKNERVFEILNLAPGVDKSLLGDKNLYK